MTRNSLYVFRHYLEQAVRDAEVGDSTAPQKVQRFIRGILCNDEGLDCFGFIPKVIPGTSVPCDRGRVLGELFRISDPPIYCGVSPRDIQYMPLALILSPSKIHLCLRITIQRPKEDLVPYARVVLHVKDFR